VTLGRSADGGWSAVRHYPERHADAAERSQRGER
jgi:hypothetical protein